MTFCIKMIHSVYWYISFFGGWNMKIGFIGAGNMAKAIIDGWVARKRLILRIYLYIVLIEIIMKVMQTVWE